MLDTEEARRARYREIIQSLTLMDDIFMTAVFQDSLPCVDLVLQIILDRPNLRATRVVTQDTLKNLHGHDLRLDIHAFADGQEFKEALINSAPPSWRILFALPVSTNPPHSATAMRPVCFLGRTKILHQSDGLHFISDSLTLKSSVQRRARSRAGRATTAV